MADAAAVNANGRSRKDVFYLYCFAELFDLDVSDVVVIFLNLDW